MKKTIKFLKKFKPFFTLIRHIYPPIMAGAIAGVSVTEYNVWRDSVTNKLVQQQIRMQEYLDLEGALTDFEEAYGSLEDYIKNFEDTYEDTTAYDPYLDFIRASCGGLNSLKISELNKKICHKKNQSIFNGIENIEDKYKKYAGNQEDPNTAEILKRIVNDKEKLLKTAQDYSNFYSKFYTDLMAQYSDLKEVQKKQAQKSKSNPQQQ